MQTQPSSLGAAMTSRRARRRPKGADNMVALSASISWHHTSEKAGMAANEKAGVTANESEKAGMRAASSSFLV